MLDGIKISSDVSLWGRAALYLRNQTHLVRWLSERPHGRGRCGPPFQIGGAPLKSLDARPGYGQDSV